MRVFTLLASALSAALFSAVLAVPANAQATRTWVSGVGDDANPCSRTAPCKTFAGAISKTATDGEINCIDPGGFGAVTITKGMTINCENTLGSVLVSGTNAIVIAPPAATTIKVTLKGIEIEGLGTGINGVSITGQGVVLHMHKIQIRKFAGNGINFAPSLSSELYVSETYITDSGVAAGTGGIVIAPSAGAAALATIENVKLENNRNGLVVNGNAAGGVNVSVKNTTAVGNTDIGMAFTATAGNVNAMLQSVVASSNATGVSVTNSNVRIGLSAVTGNNTGVVASPSFTSYKNNQIDGNVANGTPLNPATPQ